MESAVAFGVLNQPIALGIILVVTEQKLIAIFSEVIIIEVISK